MIALIVGLILLALGSVVFFFTGLFDVCINALIRIVNSRHRKLRWEQRPGRIFLIRHGESEANIDKSKYTFI
jgi:hypothetical protein